MAQYHAASQRSPFCLFLFAGFALLVSAGCGAGEKIKKYDVHRAAGRFRGVVYAAESPAPGENPLFTVDFTQSGEDGSVVKDTSTYQSTTPSAAQLSNQPNGA